MTLVNIYSYLQMLRLGHLDSYKLQEQRSVSSETLLGLSNHQSLDSLYFKGQIQRQQWAFVAWPRPNSFVMNACRTFLKITLHCDIPLPNIFLVNGFAAKTRHQCAFIKSPTNPSLLRSYDLFVMPAGICAILKVQQFSHYANVRMFHGTWS